MCALIKTRCRFVSSISTFASVALTSLCLPSLLHAQVQILTGYERLTIADGLSNNEIHCIFQDSRGFLWIGTLDGLNRYDGYSFKAFKHDPADSTSISDNCVTSICEDRAQRLWIGTGNGLNRFDPITETFTSYKPDSNSTAPENSLSGNNITTLFQDQGGNL